MGSTTTSNYAYPGARPAVEEAWPLLTPAKFGVLCLATGGLYGLWWQYKAWRFFKQRQQSDIWPVARAIFSLFTVNELFKNIDRFATREGLPARHNAGNLAAGYIILNLLARLPDPYWLVSLLAFTCLLPSFQQFTEALRQSPEYATQEQSGFSTRQLLLLVLCTLTWAMAIYGATLPD